MHKEPSSATPEEQQAAIQAAGAAARVLLRALPRSDQDLDIAEKADGSLVSSADLASQAAIQEILLPLGTPMLSEEAAAPAYEDRKDWERFWLVDPLDGTESFSRAVPVLRSTSLCATKRDPFSESWLTLCPTGCTWAALACPFNLPPSMAPRSKKSIPLQSSGRTAL